MAHFAEIDNDYNVVRVVKVDNVKCCDQDGCECEEIGVEFLRGLYGEKTTWVQTSYNGNMRKMYAGRGYIYIPESDIFAPPSPFPSWTLNRSKGEWEPPVPRPEASDDDAVTWDEDGQRWDVSPNVALQALRDWKISQGL